MHFFREWAEPIEVSIFLGIAVCLLASQSERRTRNNKIKAGCLHLSHQFETIGLVDHAVLSAVKRAQVLTCRRQAPLRCLHLPPALHWLVSTMSAGTKFLRFMARLASRWKTSTIVDTSSRIIFRSAPSTNTIERFEVRMMCVAYRRASPPTTPVVTMTMTLLRRKCVSPTSFATSSRRTWLVRLH